jgi:hypothetical protein
MLRHIAASSTTKRAIAWTTVAMFGIEVVCLGIPAARGVRSHFNTSTPVAATMFYSMGAAAHVQVAMLVWLLVLYFRRESTLSRLVVWSVRAGMILLLAAVVPGEVMIALAAHTVGAADGGPGLPITGWSTTAGDLRLAHFLGMHALQILPLAAYAITHYARAFTPVRRQNYMHFITAAYVTIFLTAAIQALTGHPFLRI